MLKKKQVLISVILGAEFAVLVRALLKQYYRMTFVCALWIILTLFFFILQHGYSRMNQLTVGTQTFRHRLVTAALMLLCMFACLSPMGISSYWNGEDPAHRNQYELMTECFLNGQLHFDYEVDPALAAMENPYDYQARIDAGVEFHWDHAYYNGHYYMYYGAAPIFLAFMPYRLVTGATLPAFRATQFFAAVFIAGVFALFDLLGRRFFPKLPFGRYLALSAAVSLLSVWYSASAPAMYCTAITAGLALMIWSLYLFLCAIRPGIAPRLQLALAFSGSLLGALVFASRPPIALANFLVIPLLGQYIQQNHPLQPRHILRAALAAIPYAVVCIALMAYNEARFDNPFEFGQSYQLTVTDQTELGGLPPLSEFPRLIRTAFSNFFAPRSLTTFGGALVNFPLLFFGAGFCLPRVRRTLRERGLLGFAAMLCALPILITLVDAMWSPVLLERYRMDIYFLMGILSFLIVGTLTCRTENRRALLDAAIFSLSMFAAVTCVHFFLIPNDGNWTQQGFPELINILFHLMTFDLFA